VDRGGLAILREEHVASREEAEVAVAKDPAVILWRELDTSGARKYRRAQPRGKREPARGSAAGETERDVDQRAGRSAHP